jgi:hypothetical protein
VSACSDSHFFDSKTCRQLGTPRGPGNRMSVNSETTNRSFSKPISRVSDSPNRRATMRRDSMAGLDQVQQSARSSAAESNVQVSTWNY